ncbi:MAG: NTP transferase domain-containing protein [Candidatus Omnitrophica bacterium]|nr:NTP transferase domain-containing protein [Candidatus Omnitrophota bacterium]
MDNIAIIILAAGKGRRMKSALPKALHPICGRPMLGYVLDLARSLGAEKTVVVTGHKSEEVRKIIPAGKTKIVLQKKLLGSGDAVKKGLEPLKGFKGTVLVLYADVALLKKETLKKLLKYHRENELDATILSAQLNKPAGYGRVLRDEYCAVRAVVEEKDANDAQKEIKEINTGIICFNKEKLDAVLKGVKLNKRKKEYYLTDTIGIFYKKGFLADAIKADDADEVMGVNSRVELSRANALMQQRINRDFMEKGISIIAPRQTFINHGVKIGRDSIIYPFSVIDSNVKIGRRCSVGPFVHLRENTALQDDVVAGNFIEIVRSKLGAGTLAKHLCYIGDSRIGRRVNIGAGSVTANFDGKKKNLTVINNGAFIGSNTVLVAPVKIGRQAVTGAGSAVVKNVPDNKVVVGVPARVLKRRD